MEQSLYLLGAVIVGLILSYYIQRWIFEVSAFRKGQERQIKLLELLARKAGATEEEIKSK